MEGEVGRRGLDALRETAIDALQIFVRVTDRDPHLLHHRGQRSHLGRPGGRHGSFEVARPDAPRRLRERGEWPRDERLGARREDRPDEQRGPQGDQEVSLNLAREQEHGDSGSGDGHEYRRAGQNAKP